MGSGQARVPKRRSPQTPAGARASPREPARSDKKKPQRRRVGVLVLVEGKGIELKSAVDVPFLYASTQIFSGYPNQRRPNKRARANFGE